MNNETTPDAGTCTCEQLCSANPEPRYSRHGIEVRPVFLGDFDRYTDRGWHQVRVNLWGWPAAVVEWFMRRNWIKRHMEPDRPNASLDRPAASAGTVGGLVGGLNQEDKRC